MKKIIYIDDQVNTLVMDSKLEIIEEIGVKIIRIESIENALELVDENIKKISLIILDIIMPPEEKYTLKETNGGTTTGLRLLKDIRHKYPDIPIILVSIKQRHNLEGIEDIIKENKVSGFFEKQTVLASDIGEAIKRLIF